MSIILSFIVVIAILGLICYVFKKTFECSDETDFEIQNRFIGRISFKKKPKENKVPPKKIRHP